MDCRENCCVCCVIPDITRERVPGMPEGKPAGVPCVHLTRDLKCAIFSKYDRPACCSTFEPEKMVCGNTRDEAIQMLGDLQGFSKKDFKKVHDFYHGLEK